MAKSKKATWWKMFSHQRAAVESVSDSDAGMGIKAAFRYFDGEDIPPGSLTPQAFTVFCVIRPYIDEAKQDYEKFVKSGQAGAKRRWRGQADDKEPHSPPIAPLSPPIGCLREAEAEAELRITLTGNTENTPLNPPRGKRERFIAPSVEDVASYCLERQNGIDPEEFVAFYESKGWKVGRASMKSWKHAVITWEKRRRNNETEADAYADVV